MSELHSETSRLSPDQWANADESVRNAEPHTYVTFELAGQIFAVEVGTVREILDLQPISRLPNAPADLLGMIDVRGQGIAVIDLLSHLGLSHPMSREEGRIVVFELDADSRKPVGVIADRVLSVVAIADTEIEPAPVTMVRWNAAAMFGVARIDGQLIMMLALDRLFKSDAAGPFDFE